MMEEEIVCDVEAEIEVGGGLAARDLAGQLVARQQPPKFLAKYPLPKTATTNRRSPPGPFFTLNTLVGEPFN
jgi:hypothetical protein